MTETFTYQENMFTINTQGVDDGDVIFVINRYPLSTTLYMTAQQARYIGTMLKTAAEEAEQKQREAA